MGRAVSLRFPSITGTYLVSNPLKRPFTVVDGLSSQPSKFSFSELKLDWARWLSTLPTLYSGI